MTGLSILEWNINQRGGCGSRIPAWVMDEILGNDIIVLVEFCQFGRSVEFMKDMEDRGYQCCTSQHTIGNNVFIAVKNDFPIHKITWVPCYGDGVQSQDFIPENLRVDIDCNGTILSVVGVRIKDLNGDYASRKEEFRWLLEWLGDIKNPIVITGDFNNLRTKTPCEDWSLAVMDSMMDACHPRRFVRNTPDGDGSSIYRVQNGGSQFAYEHFITKGVKKVDAAPYDRDFTAHDQMIYRGGRDFKWEENHKERSVPAGYPDHAILKGRLFLSALFS